MSLLEETYRKIDPEGIINLAYTETEPRKMSDVPSKEKNGKDPLEV